MTNDTSAEKPADSASRQQGPTSRTLPPVAGDSAGGVGEVARLGAATGRCGAAAAIARWLSDVRVEVDLKARQLHVFRGDTKLATPSRSAPRSGRRRPASGASGRSVEPGVDPARRVVGRAGQSVRRVRQPARPRAAHLRSAAHVRHERPRVDRQGGVGAVPSACATRRSAPRARDPGSGRRGEGRGVVPPRPRAPHREAVVRPAAAAAVYCTAPALIGPPPAMATAVVGRRPHGGAGGRTGASPRAGTDRAPTAPRPAAACSTDKRDPPPCRRAEPPGATRSARAGEHEEPRDDEGMRCMGRRAPGSVPHRTYARRVSVSRNLPIGLTRK